MEVRVVKKLEDNICECIAVQKNEWPCPPSDFDGIPQLTNGNILSVIVPFKISSASCQVDYEQRLKLEDCYFNSIVSASSYGLKSVCIPSFGVGGLYWDSIQSSSAARCAISKVVNYVEDDFKVFFLTKEEDFEIWDEVMKF